MKYLNIVAYSRSFGQVILKLFKQICINYSNLKKLKNGFNNLNDLYTLLNEAFADYNLLQKNPDRLAF